VTDLEHFTEGLSIAEMIKVEFMLTKGQKGVQAQEAKVID
jgi:hypothetical protein